MRTRAFLLVGIAGLWCWGAQAAVPPGELDYQGKVLVNDLPYNGNGYFKFAITDGPGYTNYWSNDGSFNGEPSGLVTNVVLNGVFQIGLGSPPMVPVPSSIFALNETLYLRVWFSTSTSGFAQMLPAQRIASVGYALNTDLLDGLHASNIVAAATNAVTLAGDVSGPVGNVQLGSGVIVNADVNAAAAISPTKIFGTALTQSTTFGGDVSGFHNNLQIGPNAVGSAEIAPGSITDADVSAGAAILGSKIQAAAPGTSGVISVSGGFGATPPYAAIDDSDTRLNAFGVVNGLTATAPGAALSILGVAPVYVSNASPATLRIGLATSGSLPLPALEAVIWVATNGSPAGPGTIDAPFDTPQNGYNAAASLYAGSPAAVVIAGGDYAGAPLNLSAPEVHVFGMTRPQIGAVTVALAPSTMVVGKTRVENVVMTDHATVVQNTAPVKFYNCRFEKGCTVAGSGVEFQDCAFRQSVDSGVALLIAPAGVSWVSAVGVYQCSVVNMHPISPALQIGGPELQEPNAAEIEVIGCELVNLDGITGPAVADYTPYLPHGLPIHLFAHNYIRGPPPSEQSGHVAVADPNAQGMARFIGLFNNTVYGHCGSAAGGLPHFQYFANNHVFGLINYSGPAGVGWFQAGSGSVPPDAANNTEYDVAYPGMPAAWRD